MRCDGREGPGRACEEWLSIRSPISSCSASKQSNCITGRGSECATVMDGRNGWAIAMDWRLQRMAWQWMAWQWMGGGMGEWGEPQQRPRSPIIRGRGPYHPKLQQGRI